MRCLRFLALLWLVLTLVPFSASAEDPRAVLEAEIDPEAGLSGEVLQEIGTYDGAVDGFGDKLLRLLVSTIGQIKDLHLREGLASVGLILAAALLCSLLEDWERGKGLVPLVGALTITAACTHSFGAMMTLGTQTIENLHRYTGLLFPTMASLMTASGDLSSTAVSGLGIILLNGLLALVNGLLVPLLGLLLLLGVAETALKMKNLSKLRELIQWVLVTLIKGVMYGYSAVLTFTGIVSGSLDAQRLRTLRSVVAGMVPVVGGIVSEASGSLLTAASLLKTGVGLYGMLAVFGICLGPFFQIALQYLLLKMTAALCGLFGKGSQGPLVEKLAQAMGLLLALTGIACFTTLMILVLCIRTVIP